MDPIWETHMEKFHMGVMTLLLGVSDEVRQRRSITGHEIIRLLAHGWGSAVAKQQQCV